MLAAPVLTGVTFFVTEDAAAVVPGSHGVIASPAVTRGFPVPYSVTFCCGIANGVNLLPTRTFYYQLGLLADLAVWITVSLSCAAVLGRRRLAVGAAAGCAITLLTLLLRPVSSVAPGYGAETEILRPMGFPYEFLTYYKGGLPSASFSGYQFNLSALVADYALWAGVALAVMGLALVLRGRRLPVLPNSSAVR